MDKKTEALKLALEALERALRYHGVALLTDPPQDAWKYHRVEQTAHEAITAIHEALAQPEEQRDKQEPALSDEEAEKIFLEMWEMGNEAIRNEQRKKLKGKNT